MGIGPNGLPQDSPQFMPGLDPSLPDFALHNERVKLYNALYMLDRNTTLLPLPEENVGALIARCGTEASSQLMLIGTDKSIEVNYIGEVVRNGMFQPPSYRLSFGANEVPDIDADTLLYAYGGGILSITIIWLN